MTCLEIVTTYTSDAEEIAAIAAQVAEGVADSAGVDIELAPQSAGIVAESRRLIDPETMLNPCSAPSG